MLEHRVRKASPSNSRGSAWGLRTTSTGTARAKPTSAPPRALPTAARAQPALASNRPLLLLIVMTLCAGGLVSRLVFWQVLQHGTLSAEAISEHATMAYQPPLRGRIFDSQGNPLATDVNMDTVYAVPSEIKNPARTAALVAPILGLPAKNIELAISAGGLYVPLANRVSIATGQKLQNLALPGIGLDAAVVRDYPEGSIAGQVLGYVDANNHGNYGLEGYYNGILAGKAGLRSILRDSTGHEVRISSAPPSPPHAGADLHLTLDPMVQNLVEDELHKAVQQHHADSGTIIVMDPRTGYILGMASTPGYNPNHYSSITNYSRFMNPAISDTYEPGSTFKIITMAAGLDTHTITPQTAFDDTGTFTIDGVKIHNWNMAGFGWETMTQVLQHSANVGASWVANHLGTTQFYKYIRRFRIGQSTGIGLSGEATGQVWFPNQKPWTIVSLYTNSYGQGLTVTPLQLVRAVDAVANHGVMMKPQIVRSIVYKGRVIVHNPVALGRVISPASAHTLSDMLVHSAIDGEASLAMVKGYNIAAKTGTANVAGPNGQYIPGVTIASTIGYAPAFHPRFEILAVINHPRDTPWGSMAAAPILHDLFQELFMYYHVPPSANPISR